MGELISSSGKVINENLEKRNIEYLLDMIRGVIPFAVLIVVGFGICIAFPQIILWLPGTMIK